MKLIILILILSTGCVSLETYQKRDREAYVSAHPERPRKILDGVLKGSLMGGMTPDEVNLSWLGPTRKINRTYGHQKTEQWCYPAGSGTSYYVYFTDGVVTGFQEFH